MRQHLDDLKNAERDPVYIEGKKRFAEQLRTLRTRKGYTQQVLAEALNTTRSTISNWESALCMPHAEELIFLCAALDTTPDTLLCIGAASRLAAVESDNAHLQQELRDLQEKMVDLGGELEATQAELASYKEQNEDYRTKLRNLREHNEQLNAKLETARTGIGTAADRVACSLSDQVDKLTIENERLAKQIAQLRVTNTGAVRLDVEVDAHIRSLEHRISVALLALKGA